MDRRDDAMDGSDNVEDESDPADESDAPEPSTVTSETGTPPTPTSKIQGGPIKKGVRTNKWIFGTEEGEEAAAESRKIKTRENSDTYSRNKCDL